MGPDDCGYYADTDLEIVYKRLSINDSAKTEYSRYETKKHLWLSMARFTALWSYEVHLKRMDVNLSLIQTAK